MTTLTLADIQAAHARIADKIHRTPVLTSATLDALCGGKLFFKCENFQKIGAFKARGAANAVFSLTDAEAARGVATHSSGNHAAALAAAASSCRTKGMLLIICTGRFLQEKMAMPFSKKCSRMAGATKPPATTPDISNSRRSSTVLLPPPLASSRKIQSPFPKRCCSIDC
jgi:threonine dehydratase